MQQLAATRNNVMAAGENAQCRYSFFSENFRNIMDFPKDYDNCRIITLEEKYRSTESVFDITNEIISAHFENPKDIVSWTYVR